MSPAWPRRRVSGMRCAKRREAHGRPPWASGATKQIARKPPSLMRGSFRGSVTLFVGRASARHAHQRNADCGPDLRLDLGGELGVLLQIIARVVLALPDLFAVVRVPRAGLLDDVVCNAELDHLALARDALAVENVEQRLAKWRRDLVFHDLDPGLVADDFLAALDRPDAADIESHRRIELE